MSKAGKITYNISIDTKKFKKQIKSLMGWRLRVVSMLLSIIQKILGKDLELEYEIKQSK